MRSDSLLFVYASYMVRFMPLDFVGVFTGDDEIAM